MKSAYIQFAWRDRKEILLAFLLYLTCQPFFTWSFDFTYAASSALIFLFYYKSIDIKTDINKVCLVLLIIAYLLMAILRKSFILAWLIYLSFAILPCLRKNLIARSYFYFRLIVVCTFFLSLLSLFLIMIGVPLQYELVEPINKLKEYNYLHYPFLLIPTYIESGNFARFCSVFDEPGAVGTLAGLLLCVEKYNLRKIGNIIIFISGCLSTSLYFVVITIAYMFFFNHRKYKIAFIFLFVIFFYISKDVDILQRLIWDRIAISDGLKFQGDSRNSPELLAKFDQLKYDVSILWGYGSAFVDKYADGSASIQLFILRDGLLCVSLIIFSYIILAINQIKKHSQLLFFVFFVLIGTLYQRPGFCDPFYLYLFTLFTIVNGRGKDDVSFYYNSKL